jgi:hypothetical protein
MHSESTLTPVYGTPFGTVYACSCCDRLQIDTPSVIFHFAQDRFAAFFEQVQRVINARRYTGPMDRITFRFWPGEVSLSFVPAELLALHELMDGTRAMLELDEILHTRLQRPL